MGLSIYYWYSQFPLFSKLPTFVDCCSGFSPSSHPLALTASGASCLLCEFHILQIVTLALPTCLPPTSLPPPLLNAQCAKQMHKLNASKLYNKIKIRYQMTSVKIASQTANGNGEFKGQASGPVSCSVSEWVLLLPLEGGRGLRNAELNLNYMHTQSSSQRALPLQISCAADCSHFCAAAQATPRDRRISWPFGFVVGFLGHTHTHTRTRAHSGKTKKSREAATISAICRQPNRPQRRSLCFVVQLYTYMPSRVCVFVCVWVSWRASQCDHAACKNMTKKCGSL